MERDNAAPLPPRLVWQAHRKQAINNKLGPSQLVSLPPQHDSTNQQNQCQHRLPFPLFQPVYFPLQSTVTMAPKVILAAFLAPAVMAAAINPFTGLDHPTRIIGGEDAEMFEFPYVVSLQKPLGQHFCTGSLIDAKTVLTAAHCVDGTDNSTIFVRAGSLVSIVSPYLRTQSQRIYLIHGSPSPTEAILPWPHRPSPTQTLTWRMFPTMSGSSNSQHHCLGSDLLF